MKPYIKTKDHFFSQEQFTLLYDESLEMLITSPAPENLETYYQSDSYISHSDQSKSVIDKLYLFVKNYSLKRKVSLLNTLIPKKGSVLDIGAGTGDFLLCAKQNKWIVSGVEPNELARTNAKTKEIILTDNIDALPNQNYDVVSLWHVLEHLPNLKEQIAKITKLINTNGYLIIAVPNYNSYDAEHYSEYWAAYDVPRHLWHFSEESIIKLFHPSGYKLIKTKPMWFDAYYVSLLSEKYKTGKNRYLHAFYRGFISNAKALYTKQFSSHIYILKKG